MAGGLATDWSRAFGLPVPIVNAPMGGVAGGALAAAVTRAGGLGMVGIGSAGTVDVVRRETTRAGRDGGRFGVGLLAWAVQGTPELLEAALAAGPVLVSVSFGDAFSWVDQVHQTGAAAATQVYDLETARRAEDSGVDVLVARGAEGGGHGVHQVGTLVLLQEILDVASVPVLAAGGVTSARGLAAVLAAGASGAWLGTPFLACPESLATEAVRTRVLRAGSGDTVCTGVFDMALDYPWPRRFDERVLRNDLTDRWAGAENDLLADPGTRAVLAAAIERADPALAVVDAGQGVGLVTELRSAGEVIEDLASGATALLARWATASDPSLTTDASL